MVFLFVTGENKKVLKQTKTSFTSSTLVQVAVLINFEGPVSDLIEFNATAVTPAANAPATVFGMKVDPQFRNVMGMTITVLATGTTVTADYLALAVN